MYQKYDGTTLVILRLQVAVKKFQESYFKIVITYFIYIVYFNDRKYTHVRYLLIILTCNY